MVNLECHLWLIREFLPNMLAKNKGQIVSIASQAGMTGAPSLVDYAASKFGAVGLMDALRKEMKKNSKNIVCTTVCPFFINTGMFEGVKSNMFFPMLDQDFVIQRIETGILQNEEEVHIWWSLAALINFGKLVLPAPAFDVVSRWIGSWNFMDKFTGRK